MAGKCVRLTMDPSPRDNWTSLLLILGPIRAQAMIINNICLMLPVVVSGRDSYSLHGSGILELFYNNGR